MKKLFFFGCGNNGPGHYWYESQPSGPRHVADYFVRSELGASAQLIKVIDGTFCPAGDQVQGIYKVSMVHPIMIISWWDRTIDSRPGSNSNLVGVGYFGSHEMLEDAKIKFPSFMDRQLKLEAES